MPPFDHGTPYMVPSFDSFFIALSAWYPAGLGLLKGVNRVSVLVLSALPCSLAGDKFASSVIP